MVILCYGFSTHSSHYDKAGESEICGHPVLHREILSQNKTNTEKGGLVRQLSNLSSNLGFYMVKRENQLPQVIL